MHRDMTRVAPVVGIQALHADCSTSQALRPQHAKVASMGRADCSHRLAFKPSLAHHLCEVHICSCTHVQAVNVHLAEAANLALTQPSDAASSYGGGQQPAGRNAAFVPPQADGSQHPSMPTLHDYALEAQGDDVAFSMHSPTQLESHPQHGEPVTMGEAPLQGYGHYDIHPSVQYHQDYGMDMQLGTPLEGLHSHNHAMHHSWYEPPEGNFGSAYLQHDSVH